MKNSKDLLEIVLRPSVLLTVFTFIFFLSSSHSISIISFSFVVLCLLLFFAGELLGIRSFTQSSPKKESPNLLNIGYWIYAVALASLHLNFYASGGIPLFQPTIRQFMNPLLTTLSFLIVPASLLIFVGYSNSKNSKLKMLLVFTATLFFISFTGFRTEVMVFLFSTLLVLHYTNILSRKQLLQLGIFALIFFFALTFIRTGGFDSNRISSTVSAYDFVVSQSGPLGHTNGFVQFADFIDMFSDLPIYGGRTLISTLVGVRTGVSTTSTLYGPPYADFGFMGSFIFLFFGWILGFGYKAASKGSVYAILHSLVLVFLLLGIETGIVDLIVWLYFIAALSYYKYNEI
ncbi:MAG: oligosaccharide repeat unit polymerase [archaeon]|jgi:oligosaccharide repeat unit polymerase|nr:oligosaccharide repeat unit polymerase [archaeon]